MFLASSEPRLLGKFCLCSSLFDLLFILIVLSVVKHRVVPLWGSRQSTKTAAAAACSRVADRPMLWTAPPSVEIDGPTARWLAACRNYLLIDDIEIVLANSCRARRRRGSSAALLCSASAAAAAAVSSGYTARSISLGGRRPPRVPHSIYTARLIFGSDRPPRS